MIARLGRGDRAAIVIVGAALLFAFQVTELFGRLPVPWPDESLFAEPALHLLRDGRLASPLVSGAAAGVAERTYWYPFGYFLVLAAAFAAAGATLATMRALSVIGGVGLLAATYRLGRVIGLGRSTAALAVALLSADPVFVRAALVGRPDVIALALLVASMVLGPDGSTPRRIGVGLVAGCAAILHPFAAIAGLVLLGRLARRPWRRAVPVIAGLALPVVAWGAYVLQDVPSFIDQLSLNFALHERPWSLGVVIENVLNQYPDPLAVTILAAWLTGAIGLGLAAHDDGRALPVLAAFVLTSALALSLQMWHPLYALPFMYLGVARALVAIATQTKPAARPMRRALATVSVLLTVTGIVALDADQLAARAGVAAQVRREAYADWTAAIATAIPTGSRILIGGVPDPAWGLFGRDLRLVALQDDARSYGHYAERLGSEVDYVILTGSVSRRWRDLVDSWATLERRVVVETGDHTVRCQDWVPCGPLIATIFRVRH